MDNQRIAIYVRVSTDMQGDESIENQIERCKQYLQFKGFNSDTAEVISDIASGADDGRKGLSQLMEKINNKEINVLIVTELSRLSRKIKTLINIIEAVKSNDIVIIAVIQNIDTATPMGKAMILMTGLFAELERDNLKQRVKNTMDTKARNGNHTGGVAPYGYDVINKELIPNPEKSKIVKKLFNDFILGVSLSDLARNYGIRLTTVRRILASLTYIGTKVYGTRIVNNDGKVVYADPENIKYIPNAHPPIVDEETFYTVQKMLNESVDKWHLRIKNKQKEYLLYGLLKCYNGHSMYGAESPSHYRYYKCGLHGEKVDHKFCPKKNISATEIEKDVINDILNFDISKVDIEKGKKLKEAELKRYSDNLRIEQEKVKKITDLYVNDQLEKDDYLERKAVIDKKIKLLESKIIILTKNITEDENQRKSINSLKLVIEKLKINPPFEKMQKYLHTIVNKVQFINDFEYEIYFNI